MKTAGIGKGGKRPWGKGSAKRFSTRLKIREDITQREGISSSLRF